MQLDGRRADAPREGRHRVTRGRVRRRRTTRRRSRPRGQGGQGAAAAARQAQPPDRRPRRAARAARCRAPPPMSGANPGAPRPQGPAQGRGEQAMARIDSFLRLVARSTRERSALSRRLRAADPPRRRPGARCRSASSARDETRRFLCEIMNHEQRATVRGRRRARLRLRDRGRRRASASTCFNQSRGPGAVFRIIPQAHPDGRRAEAAAVAAQARHDAERPGAGHRPDRLGQDARRWRR